MEFVYDRTAQDVLDRTKKAYLNSNDLNRIEGNTKTVADLISVPVTIKNWQIGGLPRTNTDYLRIRGNIERVRNGFGIYADTPITPIQPFNHYQKWNDIEKILFDVYNLHKRTTDSYIYCGETYAGEEIGVI